MTIQPERVQWQGLSGDSYVYTVHTFETNWYDGPGNYIFAKQHVTGKWQPIYIGEAKSLKTRLTNSHEKLPRARQNGFTHVHAHRNSGSEEARLKEERDLINHWNPPCNLQ